MINIHLRIQSNFFLVCLAALAMTPAWSARGSAEEETPIYRTDFTEWPTEPGWDVESGRGAWHARGEAAEARFTARSGQKGYWAVQFQDAGGRTIPADVYDRLPGGNAKAWRARETVIRAHPLARSMRVRFQPQGAPIEVNTLTITPTPPEAARTWIDQVAAGNPVVRYDPPAGRWARLARTRDRLESGRHLRIVMLGDSIVNDTSNSLFELLLQDAYPEAEIEVIPSVRSATGATWYRRGDRVERWVLRHEPDLLVIGGVSHEYDAGAIREVIRKTRAGSDCDILVMTGAIAPREHVEQGVFYRLRQQATEEERASGALAQQVSEALRRIETYPEALRRVCREEQAALFDMRRAWDTYILHAWHEADWFMRDSIHANHRGKQVAGRLLARYLRPGE